MKKLCVFLLVALIFSLFSCSDNGPVTEVKEVEIIHLSEMSVVLYVGQKIKVMPTIIPSDATNQTLKWTPSTKEVCSVDSDGVITALSEGVCVVTAKAENGVAASVKVEVKNLADITAVRFEELRLSLNIGDRHTLKLVADPVPESDGIPVEYSSSDERVATVDGNGCVMAIGAGSCLIRGTVDGRITAACEVTVSEADNQPSEPVDPSEPVIPSIPADLSELVELTVKGEIPRTFEHKDVVERLVSVVEITSYEVKRELTSAGVTVTLLLHGVKTFDYEGEEGTNSVELLMDLYMEDDTHCDTWLLRASALQGEDVTLEFQFNAKIRPYQRQFYVVLSETGSEEIE